MDSNPPAIHIINPLWDASGGSEWRAITLFDALKPSARCSLWTQFQPASQLAERYDIKRIVPKKLSFPKNGVLVFVGVYFPFGRWLLLTRPRRIIVVYNTFHHDAFAANRRILAFPSLPRYELVFASDMIKRAVGQPGEVESSLIDLSRFIPQRAKLGDHRAFTVGRISRDVPEKHHPSDIAVYKALARRGCHIEVMGGTVLRQSLEDTSGMTLLPASAMNAVDFLHELDCFYYRTSDSWVETFGRVVFEAMACGLPVVCHRNGGYAAKIEHGINGFLFDRDEEAIDIILRLKADPTLRAQVGAAARQTAEELFGMRAQDRILQFYLRP